MADFKFLLNPISQKWVILAPRRAKRPDVAKGYEPVCPFCPGREGDEPEVYRVPSNVISTSPKALRAVGLSGAKDLAFAQDSSATPQNDKTNWSVRVLNNKFPFAPIHEIVIHSPDHNKNFDTLPLSQVELILHAFRQRYLTHQNKGQVYIFHNSGIAGGESLPHPHTQIAVVPTHIKMDLPRLDPFASETFSTKPLGVNALGETIPPDAEEIKQEKMIETSHFYMFCPITSQWPDEVWVAPKKRGRAFGEITDEEIKDLAFVLQRLIQIFDFRHGSEFPFNFYIYPMGDWYLRVIPRLKSLGGFEIGTGIFINTQDPRETMVFIKEHFGTSGEINVEKIKTEHQAEYRKSV